MTDTLDLAPPTPAPDAGTVELPLDQLSLPAENIGSIDPDAIEQLTASIRELGVLQPITVIEITDGVYEVAFGRHRYVAAQEAGLTTIPCRVRTFIDEKERWLGMLVENLHRRTIDPVAEGTAYQRLAGLGLTQRDLADKVGRSQSHVSKRLALAELPEAAHTALAEGRLTISGAESMARIKNRETVEQLASAKGTIQDWKVEEAARDEERERAKQEIRQEQVDAGRLEVTNADDVWKKYEHADDEAGATHFFISNYGSVTLLTPKDDDDGKAEKKKRETAAEKKERLAREERDLLFTQVGAAHDEFIKAHLAGKIDAKAAQGHVNGWLFQWVTGDVYMEGDARAVAELLGLELDAEADQWEEAARAIREFGCASQANLLKALLAATFTEFSFRSLRYRLDGDGLDDDDEATYAYLRAVGYQPSEGEQAELDRLTTPVTDPGAAGS